MSRMLSAPVLAKGEELVKVPGGSGRVGASRTMIGVGGGGVLLEGAEGLRGAVFEQGEVGRFEVVDGLLVLVGDDDVDDDEFCVGAQRGDGTGPGWRRLLIRWGLREDGRDESGEEEDCGRTRHSGLLVVRRV